MSDAPLEDRLAAVERALTEGDGSALHTAPADPDLVDRVETLEEDVAELEAAVQAVRGYVGSVKHVNDEVEQRADAAMAKAEALERSLADGADVADVTGVDVADIGDVDVPDVAGGNGEDVAGGNGEDVAGGNGEDVAGGDGAGPAVDGCPRCADERREDMSTPDGHPQRFETRGPDSTAGTITDPDGRRTCDRWAQQNGDRCDDPETGSAIGPVTGEGTRSDGGNEDIRLASGTDEPSFTVESERSSSTPGAERSGSTPGTGRPRSEPGTRPTDFTNEDADGEQRQPREPGYGRVGHQRLQESDETGGLLARLREVL